VTVRSTASRFPRWLCRLLLVALVLSGWAGFSGGAFSHYGHPADAAGTPGKDAVCTRHDPGCSTAVPAADGTVIDHRSAGIHPDPIASPAPDGHDGIAPNGHQCCAGGLCSLWLLAESPVIGGVEGIAPSAGPVSQPARSAALARLERPPRSQDSNQQAG